jgi:hypothetical protein
MAHHGRDFPVTLLDWAVDERLKPSLLQFSRESGSGVAKGRFWFFCLVGEWLLPILATVRRGLSRAGGRENPSGRLQSEALIRCAKLAVSYWPKARIRHDARKRPHG